VRAPATPLALLLQAGAHRRPANLQGPWTKLDKNRAWSLTKTGCAVTNSIRKACGIMLLTTVPYLIIQVHPRHRPTSQALTLAMHVQGAAFTYPHESNTTLARLQAPHAAAGLSICFAMFITNLYYQYRLTTVAGSEDLLVDERRRVVSVRAIHEGKLSLYGIIAPLIEAEGTGLNVKKKAKAIIEPFFMLYDTDSSNSICVTEFNA
jgi:hypothetical protein